MIKAYCWVDTISDRSIDCRSFETKEEAFKWMNNNDKPNKVIVENIAAEMKLWDILWENAKNEAV